MIVFGVFFFYRVRAGCFASWQVIAGNFCAFEKTNRIGSSKKIPFKSKKNHSNKEVSNNNLKQNGTQMGKSLRSQGGKQRR